jgi:signal transduction histidine kinase/ActR/RegA family two-component response regulator
VPSRAQRLEPSSPLTSAALDRLFESIQEGLYIGTLELDTDTTIVANPHLKLMFGHPPEADAEAVRPFEPERFVDPHARAAFIERLRRDGSVADYLLRLRRADDSLFWIEVTAHLDSSNGEPQHLLALLRDVSERRKLEEQGRNIYQQVLQSEKMAVLGQTVSGVAHELNNPLATILTWSERLSSRSLDDVAKRGIQTILSESERAAKIVRKLLTFSRKRHTTRGLIELNQIVRETLLLRAYDQRVSNIRTVEALADGLPTVFADPHQIKQVLLNLLVNAEQAMLSENGRGTMTIRTWHDADQESVVLEVNDNGPGVPDQVQAKIFEPFFTTKSVGQGTGLGLTVAYAIVQEHGGRIRIASKKGKGASFFVEFPLTTTVSQKVARPTKSEDSTGKGARVLVAEDESALSTAVSEALMDAGFQVDCARDGQEALDRIKAKTYDLLICDLKMPRMDGPTLHRLLTQIKPALAHRTIFVTGDVAETENERFLEESGCPWLAKPFRLADLLAFANDVVSQLPRRN